MASPKVSCGSRVVSRPCCGEEIDEQLADGIDAGLVVAAAVGVHGLAQQGEHGLLGRAIGDLGFCGPQPYPCLDDLAGTFRGSVRADQWCLCHGSDTHPSSDAAQDS